MKRKGPSDKWALDPRVQGVFFLFLASAFFLTRLGLHGMANYDDCFYAQKAKEMVASGAWWLPTFNGVPAFDNPPFYLWLMVLSYKALGVTVFAAQLPSACMGVLTVLLVLHLGDRLFGASAGFPCALVLVTTLLFGKYARHAMVDVTLSFLVCFALLAVWEAVHKDRRYFLLWGLACGCAVLTKSVLGFFPGLIAVIWLVATGRTKELTGRYFILGALLAAGVGGSWYWVETATFGSDFLHRHFGWLVLHRGFGNQEGSIWGHLIYLQDLLVFYWPWLPVLGFACFQAWRNKEWRKEAKLLVLIWAGTIFLVMSSMGTRSHWYVLPAFPALALLTGSALAKVFSREKVLRWTMGVGAALVLLISALPISLDRERERSVRELAPLVKRYAQEGATLTCFGGNFNGLNNALLFFSDHAVPQEGFMTEPSQVEKAFKSKGTVLCLVYHKGRDLHATNWKDWYLLLFTDDLVLLSNRRLEID